MSSVIWEWLKVYADGSALRGPNGPDPGPVPPGGSHHSHAPQQSWSKVWSTKYIYTKSTTVYSMSPRRNWDSPTPLSPASVPLPPEPKGGGACTRLRVRGWGSPNSKDWRKSLALCLLCGMKSANVSGCKSPIFFVFTRTHLSAPSKKRITQSVLIIKNRKCPSYIRKYRKDRVQSHIWLMDFSYMR
jgi:hypothetical protein